MVNKWVICGRWLKPCSVPLPGEGHGDVTGGCIMLRRPFLQIPQPGATRNGLHTALGALRE